MKIFRTKIPDLEVFLYGFCYFDVIFTKAIERRLRGCFANSQVVGQTYYCPESDFRKPSGIFIEESMKTF